MGRTACWAVVALLVLVAPVRAEELSNRYPKGERLGSGMFKDVYSVAGRTDLVVGVLKEGSPEGMLQRERGMLRRLEKVGVPTAAILEVGTYEGRAAFVQKAYVTGNRAESWDKVRGKYLNETSLEDVAKIEKALLAAKLDVLDAQFLLGEDGHVVLNDPLKIERLTDATIVAKPVLDDIAARARQAIAARNLKALLKTMPGAEDPKLASYFERGELYVAPSDAEAKTALREALLHYLETGATNAAAKEVAAAVRSGRLVLELEPSRMSTITKNGIVVPHNQTFPKIAADLVREGMSKLHGGTSKIEADVVGTARALEFLQLKKAPAGLSNEPYVLLHSNPAALVRLLAIPHPALEDGERARLEGVAHRIFERGGERGERSPTPGMLGGVDRLVRERSRVAVAERR